VSLRGNIEAASALLGGSVPAVVLVRTETQRVGCPYGVRGQSSEVKCPGHADITAEFRGAQMQIRGFHDPHKCVVCGRFFKLVPVVQVRGERIPGE
jgi:hypothetical protein